MRDTVTFVDTGDAPEPAGPPGAGPVLDRRGHLPPRPDVVVVGGGPVGLVAAIHAADAGLSVAVIEPRTLPVDKACGEGIMPAGVRELAALGIHPPGHPIRGITYVDDRWQGDRGPRHPGAVERSATSDGRAGRRHARVEASLGRDGGLGVERKVLHRALAQAASSRGVSIVQDRVVALHQAPGCVQVHLATGSVVTAGHVIAADGLLSPTRTMLGLDRRRVRSGAGRASSPGRVGRRARHGLRRHFRVRPWTDHVEVYWGRVGEAYVTPVAADTVGVAILTRQTGRFDDLLATFPLLRERLADAVPVDRVRGAGPFGQAASRHVAGRVLLVGDASGYVDAITGEGLTLGWQQARAAVHAVASADPGRYERDWRLVGLVSRVMARALTCATAHRPVHQRIVPAAARAPWLFRGAVRLAASALAPVRPTAPGPDQPGGPASAPPRDRPPPTR